MLSVVITIYHGGRVIQSDFRLFVVSNKHLLDFVRDGLYGIPHIHWNEGYIQHIQKGPCNIRLMILTCYICLVNAHYSKVILSPAWDDTHLNKCMLW